jgi:hypothetical protein
MPMPTPTPMPMHRHTNATATATKVEGEIWVTWQLLAAVGEDSWWRQISLSSSINFLNGRYVFAYFLFLWCRANIGDENRYIVGVAVTPLLDFSHHFCHGVDCTYCRSC